jgi:hypothetical protein
MRGIVVLHVMDGVDIHKGEELLVGFKVTFGRLGVGLATQNAVKVSGMGNVVNISSNDVVHHLTPITVKVATLSEHRNGFYICLR